MKRTLLALICLCGATTLFAQTASTTDNSQPQKTEQTQSDKASAKLYGFVRSYYYYDNRANFQSGDGLTNRYPKDEANNVFGEDMNDVSASSLMAITTRIGLDLTGPKILNAKSSGKIEMDFAGNSSLNYLIRLRQAYTKLDWGKHALLLGQTWHPMAVDLAPDVLSMAVGAPYNTLNRSPQLQYTYTDGGFNFLASALYQMQYVSPGPSENSTTYSVHSNIPEIVASVAYKNNGFVAGMTFEYLNLKPRTIGACAVSINGVDTTITRTVDDRVWSFTPSIFVGYASGLWSFKAKTTYGENVAHLNMMGGYGVTDVNSDGSYDYEPLRNSTSWVNVAYGKKYKFSLFAGYFKNFGAEDDFVSTDKIYSKDCNNIDQMFRITPVLSYNIKAFSVGIEYEMNAVDYGTVQLDGTVEDTHRVYGHRICTMVKYDF